MFIPILSLVFLFFGLELERGAQASNQPGVTFSPNDYFLNGSPSLASVSDDDNKLLQNLLDIGGEINLEPNRIYNITQPLVVRKASTKIYGHNALIKYQKEQDNIRRHLFIVEDKDSVQFTDLRIQYLGTFSYKDSYGGKISGIYVEGSDYFLARNIEAFGFNRAGIDLATELNAPYNNFPKIENCYLHHNRVAGCAYGNNESGEIRNNTFTYNGLEEDTDTGYGFAGWSSSLPKNTLVENNNANYNFRKGLDFHSGENGIIRNNKCIGNRIIGIFALNVHGQWEIINNVVDLMDGSKVNYHTVSGIEVGNRNKNRNPSQKINFKIEDNIIDNFTGSPDKDKASYPIHIQANYIGASSIVISNNTIRSGAVTSIIRVNVGNIVVSDYYDILINKNILIAKTVRSPAIYFRGPNNRRKIVQDNRITISQDSEKVGYAVFFDQSRSPENCYILNNNKFFLPAINDSKRKLIAFRIQKRTNERITKNKINNKKTDSWSGIKDKSKVNQFIKELLNQ